MTSAARDAHTGGQRGRAPFKLVSCVLRKSKCPGSSRGGKSRCKPPPQAQPSPAVSLCTAAIPGGAGDAGPLGSGQDCPHAAAGSRDEGSQGTESAASIPAYMGLGHGAGSVPIGETGSGPQGCPQSPSPPTACPRLSCHPAGCTCSGSWLFISRERPPATPLPGPWGSHPLNPPHGASGLCNPWSPHPPPGLQPEPPQGVSGAREVPAPVQNPGPPRGWSSRLCPLGPHACSHAHTHVQLQSLTRTHTHSHSDTLTHTHVHTHLPHLHPAGGPTARPRRLRVKCKHSPQASPEPLSLRAWDTAWHMRGHK